MKSGNRKNSLDNLAQSFLTTRPAAFTDFLNKPLTDGNSQPSEPPSASSQPNSHPASLTQTDEAVLDSVDLTNQLSVSSLEKTDDQLPTTHPRIQSVEQPIDLSNQTKRPTLPGSGKRKNNESYESLFLGKSTALKADYNDVRVLIRGTHSHIIKKLLMYAEHNRLRVSAQGILDNILRHHFETYAGEIKQIEQTLLNTFQQQFND